MVHIDFPASQRWFWLVVFLFMSSFLQMGYAHSFSVIQMKKGKKPNVSPQETIVRIAGQIIEQSSNRPVRNANVMLISGELALSTKKTDDEGKFEFYIPAQKISTLTLDLRINYLNHIFSKDDIRAVSHDMVILINGAILLEESPMSEYSLPIHRLDDPKIGQVHIRS